MRTASMRSMIDNGGWTWGIPAFVDQSVNPWLSCFSVTEITRSWCQLTAQLAAGDLSKNSPRTAKVDDVTMGSMMSRTAAACVSARISGDSLRDCGHHRPGCLAEPYSLRRVGQVRPQPVPMQFPREHQVPPRIHRSRLCWPVRWRSRFLHARLLGFGHASLVVHVAI